MLASTPPRLLLQALARARGNLRGNLLPRPRPLGGSAPPPEAPPQPLGRLRPRARLEAAFAVPVPSRLEVRAAGPGCPVRVERAEDHEAVRVALVGRREAVARWAVAQDGPAVTVAGPAGAGGVEVAVWAPERYCSVDVATAGAAVAVERVTEADLAVDSGGGAVALGSIRGADVAVRSGGGAVSGSVTAAEVAIATGGGPADLQRLVGRRVAVATAGGALAARTVYGDDVDLRTAGGAVELGVAAAERAAVDSGGGAVTVGDLSANLAVASGGGRVALQCSQGVGAVRVDAGGADVECSVSPEATLAVDVAGEVALAPDLELAGGREGADGPLVGELRPRRQPGRKASAHVFRGDTATAGALVVRGARATRLRLRSWFEGLRERLGGDGAPAVDKEIRFPETDLRRQ